MGEHAHVYVPVIHRVPLQAGVSVPAWEIIVGYRCECGEPRPLPRLLFADPVATARAYLRVTYRTPWKTYPSPWNKH